MSTFKNKLINLHPTLSKKQLDVLLGAYNSGIEESIVFSFANPALSAELMSLAKSDVMDGYFVNTWLDLDFSEDQMKAKRDELLMYERSKVRFKI